VGLADCAGHVPAWSELELFRTLRILGHPQAGGADQRQPLGVRLGSRVPYGTPAELVYPGDFRDTARFVLYSRAAADPCQRSLQGVLRKTRGTAVLRRGVSVPDDDGTPD